MAIAKCVLGIVLAAGLGCGSDDVSGQPDAAGPAELPRLIRTASSATWTGGGIAPEGTELAEVVRDDGVTHDGASTVRMRMVGAFGDDVLASVDPVFWDIRLLRRRRVRMTAYIKTEEASGASAWIRLEPEVGPLVLLANGIDPSRRLITGTNDFTAYSHVFEVPRTASDAYFGALLVGSGTMWVGAVTFEEVGPEVETTPLAFPQ